MLPMSCHEWEVLVPYLWVMGSLNQNIKGNGNYNGGKSITA
jgi:hypothetical protein